MQACTQGHWKCSSVEQVLLCVNSSSLSIYIVSWISSQMLETKARKSPRTLSLLCWKEIWGMLISPGAASPLQCCRFHGIPGPGLPVSTRAAALATFSFWLFGSQARKSFRSCELLGLRRLHALWLITVAVTPAPFTVCPKHLHLAVLGSVL